MARWRRVEFVLDIIMSIWLCILLISVVQADENNGLGGNFRANAVRQDDARIEANRFGKIQQGQNFDGNPVRDNHNVVHLPDPAAQNPKMAPIMNRGDGVQHANINQQPNMANVDGIDHGNRFHAGNEPKPAVVPQPPYPKASIRKGTTIKLADHPDCEKDIKMYCPSSSNNFAVLGCLQNDLKSDQDISEDCQHIVYKYKQNLTLDTRFDSAVREVCKDELDKFEDCKKLSAGIGHRIPCLIENKNNITSASCKTFLTKMAAIVFSDYRLIHNFAQMCQANIDDLKCGRLHKESDDFPHSQGRTVECLSKDVKKLDENCKHEILRIAELQADDYHLDRPLYYACRADRERMCKRTKAGSGKVYKCLMRHKFDRDMSPECQEKLTHHQKLMQSNYKMNKGLAQACQRAILENKCITDQDPGFKHARLSKVVLCLEHVMKDGVGNVEPECIAELKEVRQSLMEDYQISPEIVSACSEEIRMQCDGGVHREGKTLHCLMDLAKPNFKAADPNMRKPKLGVECMRELEALIKEADVGEDWTIDPALRDACGSVVQVHCKDIQGGEGRVLNCLMEHIDSNTMTDECEERLLEVHYFLARDFNLDPRLYKFCHKDAQKLCQADHQWHETDQTAPERGPLTFACLYRHLKLYPKDSEFQLSRACSFEVRRVMRQRAISVDLEPRIEEPCMADLGAYCSEEVEKHGEMDCLQHNYDSLSEECRWAVGNFTEDEDSEPEMDKLLMKSCSPMIKSFCSDLLKDRDAEPGDVMECLIQHKNDHEMDDKCAAGIEHHQLITLKDYHFSVKFKEACKDDVMKSCQNVRKKKKVPTATLR